MLFFLFVFRFFEHRFGFDQNNAYSSGNGEIGHFENYTCHDVGNGKHEHQAEIVGEFGNGATIARTCSDDIHAFCTPYAEEEDR